MLAETTWVRSLLAPSPFPLRVHSSWTLSSWCNSSVDVIVARPMQALSELRKKQAVMTEQQEVGVPLYPRSLRACLLTRVIALQNSWNASTRATLKTRALLSPAGAASDGFANAG